MSKANYNECLLDEIQDLINKIDNTNDLRKVYLFYKDRGESLGRQLKYKLSKGDNVLVRSKDRQNKGVIVKVNRTRALVSIEGMGEYHCPLSMITKV